MNRQEILFALCLAFATPHAIWGQGNAKQLTIHQLFELVEANSKSLRAQRSNEEIAQQGIQVAKSQKLPDINTSLSASYIGNALMTNRHFGDAHGLHSPHFGNDFALEARQTIYAGGALNTGVRLAEIAAREASVGTKQVREQERLLAIGEYLDIAKIDNRIKVVEKNIELTQRLLNDIKAREAQGMALKCHRREHAVPAPLPFQVPLHEPSAAYQCSHRHRSLQLPRDAHHERACARSPVVSRGVLQALRDLRVRFKHPTVDGTGTRLPNLLPAALHRRRRRHLSARVAHGSVHLLLSGLAYHELVHDRHHALRSTHGVHPDEELPLHEAAAADLCRLARLSAVVRTDDGSGVSLRIW